MKVGKWDSISVEDLEIQLRFPYNIMKANAMLYMHASLKFATDGTL